MNENEPISASQLGRLLRSKDEVEIVIRTGHLKDNEPFKSEALTLTSPLSHPSLVSDRTIEIEVTRHQDGVKTKCKTWFMAAISAQSMSSMLDGHMQGIVEAFQNLDRPPEFLPVEVIEEGPVKT